MLTRATDNIIEDLIDATYGDSMDQRGRQVFAHALRGLVRLAKSEQRLEMRRDADRAAGLPDRAISGQQTHELLRRMHLHVGVVGGKLVSGRPPAAEGGKGMPREDVEDDRPRA